MLDECTSSVQTMTPEMARDIDAAFGYGTVADRMSDDDLACAWAQEQARRDATPAKPKVMTGVQAHGKLFVPFLQIEGEKKVRKLGRYTLERVAWQVAADAAKKLAAG